MQKIMLNLVAVAAVAGWVAAFLSMSESSDLEDRLTSANVRLSEASEQLTNTRTQLALQQGAVGNLKDIDERMAAKQAEAAALDDEIEAKRSELGTLRQGLDSSKIELGAMADRVAASKAVLSRLTQDQEGEKVELSRLRAESERQQEAMIGSPTEIQTAVQAPEGPTAPVAAPATTEPATVAAIPAANPLADARRRFARIDQDGDGRIDRVDFRVKRVSLFGLVDATEDDYLTLDETLLSPEAFQNFDSDGDGKISSLEMADRRSFSVMDADRDEFVTFEEYVKFLRVGPE